MSAAILIAYFLPLLGDISSIPIFSLALGFPHFVDISTCSRELLVSIRYNEPGWQWSGGFLCDHLGDTQVKMRNYDSNVLNMIRVEVQNADVSIGDEKIVGSLRGSSGTNLILLSDDDTGYMPYRIDNFSKEVGIVVQLIYSPHEMVLQNSWNKV
jgi:hypothetical protein